MRASLEGIKRIVSITGDAVDSVPVLSLADMTMYQLVYHKLDNVAYSHVVVLQADLLDVSGVFTHSWK